MWGSVYFSVSIDITESEAKGQLFLLCTMLEYTNRVQILVETNMKQSTRDVTTPVRQGAGARTKEPQFACAVVVKDPEQALNHAFTRTNKYPISQSQTYKRCVHTGKQAMVTPPFAMPGLRTTKVSVHGSKKYSIQEKQQHRTLDKTISATQHNTVSTPSNTQRQETHRIRNDRG